MFLQQLFDFCNYSLHHLYHFDSLSSNPTFGHTRTANTLVQLQLFILFASAVCCIIVFNTSFLTSAVCSSEVVLFQSPIKIIQPNAVVLKDTLNAVHWPRLIICLELVWLRRSLRPHPLSDPKLSPHKLQNSQISRKPRKEQDICRIKKSCLLLLKMWLRISFVPIVPI